MTVTQHALTVFETIVYGYKVNLMYFERDCIDRYIDFYLTSLKYLLIIRLT